VWSVRASGTEAWFEGVHGAGGEVWIVGGDGAIARVRDQGKAIDDCSLASKEDLHAVWVTSIDDVWIAGSEHIHHITSAGTKIATRSGPERNFPSVWAGAADDVWFIGHSVDHPGKHELLMHTRDGGLTFESKYPGTGGFTSRLFGTSPSDLWIDGAFTILHSTDGGTTFDIPPGWPPPQTEEQYSFGGSGPNDVWILGGFTFLRTTDRGKTFVNHWKDIPHVEGPIARPYQVFSLGNAGVWMVATGGIFRRQKSAWVRETEELPAAIWGSRADDLWAVGESGLILHRP